MRVVVVASPLLGNDSIVTTETVYIDRRTEAQFETNSVSEDHRIANEKRSDPRAAGSVCKQFQERPERGENGNIYPV